LLVGFVACVAIPFAFLSGSALRSRVPDSPLINRHITLAHELLPLAAVFGLALAAFVFIDMLRRGRSGELNQVEERIAARQPRLIDYARRHQLSGARAVSATLLVVLAIATGVQVYRVGDAGAKAAWQGRLSASRLVH